MQTVLGKVEVLNDLNLRLKVLLATKRLNRPIIQSILQRSAFHVCDKVADL